MAYTSVIPVRRLDRTVDYVQNKAKTTPKSLEEAVDYAANRDKTESACFETGLGCTTTSAFEDMRLNTLRWHKETGVQGYHLVQSFVEGEVTPELAHQIGVEFAEQLLHGKYQAIVTTHLNTKHYIEVSDLAYSYNKFYAQNMPDKVAWETLQSDLFANLPQIKAERMPQDFSVVLPKLWRKRQAWDTERTKRPPYRGEER